MAKKINIAVVFGGNSTEHEISLRSVEFILNNLNKDKYDVLKIGITRNGQWFLYNGGTKKIINGTWESESTNKNVFFNPNYKSKNNIVVLDKNKYTYLDVDVVFPVLHGLNGEDGTIQGIFELSNIPFVGCGVLASAVCMDKIIAHGALEAAGIKTAKYLPLFEKELRDVILAKEKIENSFNYPVYVKPSRQGSSIGVSKASNEKELFESLELAKKHDNRIVVEETLIGQEVEVAVMGNNNPISSIVGEIITTTEFYDYDSKYMDDSARTIVPAGIDDDITKRVKKIAIEAYRKLDCKGLARVDFFVLENGEIVLNEINTMPGFTSISMYPRLFTYEKMSGEELVDSLVSFALERKSEC